jgi:hypothetical protein
MIAAASTVAEAALIILSVLAGWWLRGKFERYKRKDSHA